MRFSKSLIDAVTSTIECATSLRDYPNLPVWTRKKLVRHDRFHDAIQLLAHDDSAQEAISTAREELANWSENDLFPVPLLTGELLAKAGYRPGPFFGRVLAELENRQLAGELTTESQALVFVETQAEKSD